MPALGQVYISVFSKIGTTSLLTLSLLSIKKRYCYNIKLCLEHENIFRVTDFWTSSADIVLPESLVSTLLPTLGAMFSPSCDSLFILFRNVPRFWPYYAAIFLDESLFATLLHPLVPVALVTDGLLLLSPHLSYCLFCLKLLTNNCLFCSVMCLMFDHIPQLFWFLKHRFKKYFH